MSAVQDVSGGLVAEMEPGARLEYTFDWADALEVGDTIAASTWTATGLSLTGMAATGTTATAWFEGGKPGSWAAVTNHVVTAAGRQDERVLRVFVKSGAGLGVGVLSVFPSLSGAVAELRRDRLMQVARRYMPGVAISDDYLLAKLRAAEADLERRLRVFLVPTELVPQGTPQAEIDALVAAGKRVVEEPGYDYDPDMWQGNTWGLIELRQRPIITVHSIRFAYPSPGSSLFTIPAAWIRPDKKYGRVNIVPVQGAVTVPANMFLMSALGGGRNIPFMIQVRYTAGLANAAVEHPDILDIIKKSASLSIVEDQYLPQSGSVSVDGLSQSLSVDTAKYRDHVDQRVDTLRQSLQGIRMVVM